MYDLKVSDEDAAKAVTAYREAHAPVVHLWSNLEKAAIYAVRENKRVKVNRVVWYVQGRFLYCELPSGRRLAYYRPEVRMVRRRDKKTGKPYGDPLPKLYHWGVNPLTRKWELEGTYGGRLAENVTSGVARDLMAEAMIRIAGTFDIVLTVHDEILAEGPPDRAAHDFEKLMAALPLWAEGLPVKVAGWKGSRYKK